MATAKKNAHGTWSINVYVGKTAEGKNICKHLTARTKKEVEAKALEVLSNKKKTVKSLTVRECFDKYIETRRPLCKPRTIRDYIRNANCFPELLNLQPADLTDEICQQAIDRFSKTHAPKTTVDRWNYLHTAVSYFDKSFRPLVRLPSVRRKRLDFPRVEKFQQLFLYIQDRNIEIPVLLGATCGLRRSEISALDFETDVDFENHTIRINKSAALDENNRYVVSSPKTDAANRVVVCPDWVIERIKAALSRPSFVLLSPNSITTGWRRLALRFDIQCSFHGLRHFFASVMESEAISWTYQKRVLGHTTNYMLNRYQEYLRETQSAVDEKLSARLESLNPLNNDSTNSDL